jgi:hypothetical protein
MSHNTEGDEIEHHLCSNSVELVPVNSSSESESESDGSFSVEALMEQDEDKIVVFAAEESVDDETDETLNSHSKSSLNNNSNSNMVVRADSHPLSCLKRTNSINNQDQQQQDLAAACAYDCFTDHITNIFCPVSSHAIENQSEKSLAPDSGASCASSSHPASTNAHNTSVCDPDSLRIEIFQPSPQGTERSDGAFFSSFNFWASSEEDRRRQRELQRQQRRPQNRSRCSKKQRDRYLQHLADKWHPPLQDMGCHAATTGSVSTSSNHSGSCSSGPVLSPRTLMRSKSLTQKSQRLRKKRQQQQQQRYCYDSDPEQEYSARRKRLATLEASRSRTCRRFSSMSLHVGMMNSAADDADLDLVTASDRDNSVNSRRSSTSALSICTAPDNDCDDQHTQSTAYGTANDNMGVLPPLAPRHGDRINFDFVTTNSNRNQDGGEATGEETSMFTASRTHGSTASFSTAGADNTVEAGQDASETASSVASSFIDCNVTPANTDALTEQWQPRRPLQQLHMPLPERCEPPFFQSPTQWTEFHLLYSAMDDFTKSHVQELSNVRFPLIWHPPYGKKHTKPGKPPVPTSTPSPLACHGVFEVGAHLEHTVVQPKFTWSPVLQPNLEDDRKILLSGSQPHSVELLSIIRVNTPTPTTRASLTGSGWDRNLYPFCRLDRTLCVTTNDLTHPYLVFEARSQSERDWLAMALKLIVARLASIIIVRDEDMLLEFFSPYSALLQLEDDEESDEETEEVAAASAPLKVVSATDALDTLIPGNTPASPDTPFPTAKDDRDEINAEKPSRDDSLDDTLSTEEDAILEELENAK